jgi:capsular exopolysaccharide synthesis family protein
MSARLPSKLLADLNPSGPAAESYRLLRSNLRFASVDRQLRSLVVTSAVGDEGKSLTAANLAISMAQSGLRTVLVDADLRKPSQASQFMVPGREGLSTVLVGIENLDAATHETDIENLWLITSGERPPNPAELVLSASMRNIHRVLTTRFDLVVYDSPPVLAAVEAAELAALADGVIVVVRANSTPKDAVRQAVDQLRHAHANVFGTVLNAARRRPGYGYYHYTYTYWR